MAFGIGALKIILLNFFELFFAILFERCEHLHNKQVLIQDRHLFLFKLCNIKFTSFLDFVKRQLRQMFSMKDKW